MSKRVGIGAAAMMTAAVLLGGSAGHAQSKPKGPGAPSLAGTLTTPMLKCSGFAKAKASVKNDTPFAFEGQLRFGSTLTPITVGKDKTEELELAGDALSCAGPLSLSVALLHKDPIKAHTPIATKTFAATRVNYTAPNEKFTVPNLDGFWALSLPMTTAGNYGYVHGFACGQPMTVTLVNKLVKAGKPAAITVTLQGGAKKVAASYAGDSSTQVTLDTLNCDQGAALLTLQVEGGAVVKIPVESIQFF